MKYAWCIMKISKYAWVQKKKLIIYYPENIFKNMPQNHTSTVKNYKNIFNFEDSYNVMPILKYFCYPHLKTWLRPVWTGFKICVAEEDVNSV
jgi:hypothetical protein